MQVSVLLAEFEQSGVDCEEYRGVRSARYLGEPQLTPALLQETVLLYDWSWRNRVAVHGPDARKWLNGMISANVQNLAPGTILPSFQLDPKGHILATFDIACTEPDSFLLITEESQAPALAERLQRYVFISKLQIDAYPQPPVAALAVRGSGAQKFLQRAGLLPVPEQPGVRFQADSPVGSVTLCLSQPGGVDLVEIEADAAQAPALWSHLQRSGAVPAGTATQECDRILSGVPRFGIDIRGAELPQETGQMEALNFNKGCYVGQEIVERIRSRGSVHRLFSAFLLQAPVPAGSAILIDEKEVGIITSVTTYDDAAAALGYIRRPHNEPDTAFTVARIAGRVRASLSFLKVEAENRQLT